MFNPMNYSVISTIQLNCNVLLKILHRHSSLIELIKLLQQSAKVFLWKVLKKFNYGENVLMKNLATARVEPTTFRSEVRLGGLIG